MRNPGERVAWIDCAKGATILLIVLHHATSYERAIFGDSWDLTAFKWSNLDMFLYHVRLPLFFFISGLVASGFLSDRPGRLKWPTARGYALLYVLWSIGFLYLIPDWPNAGASLVLSTDQVLGLALGQSMLWYLWAILLCLLISHATRWLPGWAVVVAAISVSAFASYEGGLPGNLPALARSLPFYLIGFRYPSLATTEIARIPRFAATVFLLLSAYLAWSHLSIVWLDAALDLIGVVVGMLAAKTLTAKFLARAEPLKWFGRRTLCIYILHFPIIAAFGDISYRALGALPPGHPLVYIYAPLLTLSTVGCSLALHRLLDQVGVGWLFTPGSGPRIFSRAVKSAR
jgi:fucose 4-O-acetylase-like acetyltransferase